MATEQDLGAQKKLAEDLYEAVNKRDVVKVRSLLGQGADPNHQLYWSDEWGYKDPPLHFACYRGYLEIAKTLVTHGARTDKGGGMDKTPLHWACRGGNKEMVQYLIQELKCSTDMRDKDNMTPLQRACMWGKKDVVQYLVEERKMDVDVRDNQGQSPLDNVLEGLDDSYLEGCVDVALYLMSRGCACGDEDKARLLCVACDFGKLGVVKELVEQYKVDPNSVTDDYGETPLDLATQEGHTEIADYLKSLPQQSAVTGDTDSRSDENGPPPTKKQKSAQQVTLRVCPNCEKSCHIRCKKCPECEHEFPPSSKSRAKPDQDIVKNPSNLLQILQKKVDQLSLLGFDIVVLVHRDSSKSHDSSSTSHDTPSRSRHTYRKFVTSGLAESFVESPLVYGSWKDFCSSDKTSTGHAQKSKNPRKKKGVQTNTTTTTQEGDRSHDTSGVSHDQDNVSQDSNGANTQSQAAQSSTAPLSVSDLTPLWNTISSLRQQIDSMQSSLNAPPTHAYPQHMYPPATGLMNTGQSTFVPVPGGGLFNTPLPNHFTGPSSHNSMLGQSSRFNVNPMSFPMFPFSPAPANYRFPSSITPLESSRQPMNSDPNTDSIDP
ncbi:ankyrin repeat domain-containing protein 6-like isoform X3 [Halichondria panicea]|uniref:ankyrin repeat domain-containing protein 6-like isoform X3 n=1 Tax=Halichondria panicea TaxID=6063 RepID=UPI00312B3ED7